MSTRRQTILLVDESGELATRLEGAKGHRELVKCARSGRDVLVIIGSVRFDVVVLHHPEREALETVLLPALAMLPEPPRLLVVTERDDCAAIAARFGVMSVCEPVGADALVAAIDHVRERDLRVVRP